MIIPGEVDFEDLHLSRDHDGELTFDWEPIEKICELSAVDIELFREGDTNALMGFILAWYQAHRAQGGPADAVAEELMSETLETWHEGRFVFPPGHA